MQCRCGTMTVLSSRFFEPFGRSRCALAPGLPVWRVDVPIAASMAAGGVFLSGFFYGLMWLLGWPVGAWHVVAIGGVLGAVLGVSYRVAMRSE